MLFDRKRVLITGGTGSLGKILLGRLLSGEEGIPEKIIIFSRDEAKQHALRVEYLNNNRINSKAICHNFENIVEFCIGDVRDYHAIATVLRNVHLVFNAAALKQVPACEYFPYEAVKTNICGPENIVRAIRELNLDVETVVGISTDKAAKPVNVMGMTKALQERIITRANMYTRNTRFIVVRYGNVLASRGSVIPLFHEQIRNGGPVTITHKKMTRFLLSLHQAVDLIFQAIRKANPGETFIPKAPSALITDIATALIEGKNIETEITGIRPGEKLHEILISEDEARRTFLRDKNYVISPILPELCNDCSGQPFLGKEYSSADGVMSLKEVRALLTSHSLMVDNVLEYKAEMIR